MVGDVLGFAVGCVVSLKFWTGIAVGAAVGAGTLKMYLGKAAAAVTTEVKKV